MKNSYLEKGISSHCYGCGSCVNICPVGAIELKSDHNGFTYPKVNDKCIECGKCNSICPYDMNDVISNNGKFYQAAHKDTDVLVNSQSGGMFTAISDEILSKNGAVYGAIIGNDLKVKHIRAIDKSTRDLMRGSKYVQSYINPDIYNQIKADLDNHLDVLFTGTPCQCASVRKRFNNPENLYICDFICHGVPSPLLWEKYVNFIEHVMGDKVNKAIFRHKICENIGNHIESFATVNNKEMFANDYAALFYTHLAHRESCFECQFASLNRFADITIGGYLEPSDFDAKYDSSMLIINTDKGKRLFEKITSVIDYQESKLKSYHNQPCLYNHIDRPDGTENFWSDIKNDDFEDVIKKYATKEIKTKFRLTFFNECKHICIVNAHWSNRGDEAALRPILNAILKNTDDTMITVIFKDRNVVKGFPYGGRVRHISAQFLPEDLDDVMNCVKNGISAIDEMSNEIECIKNSDLIIYSPGGAVISDKFWWRKQIEYLTPFICAKEYNIPIMVAAPSIGPFEDYKDRDLLRSDWLNYAKTLIVREHMSEEYLHNIGVNSAITTIDTAFYDDPSDPACEKILSEDEELTNFLTKHSKVVGVTLSDFSWHVVLSKDENLKEKNDTAIREFLDKMSEKGNGVLLIPQLFGNQNDIDFLRKYADSDNVFILSDEYDTYFQQYIISKCYALVGMRYHSCIFAAKAKVPFIAIGYEEKMFGFMYDWGLDNYLIKILELDNNKLASTWDYLVLNYDNYQQKLESLRETWRSRAAETINSIIGEINAL